MNSDEDIDLEINYYQTSQAPDDALDNFISEKSEPGFMAMSNMIAPFHKFIPEGVVGLLREEGFPLTGKNITTLLTFLSMISRGRMEIHAKKAEIKREELISKRASEFSEILKDIWTDDGWRYVWGEEDYDPDDDKPEPEDSINVPELLERLDSLKRSADERAKGLKIARTTSFLPTGNRTIWERHFYWVALLWFWRDELKRDIGTSTKEGVDSYGPLVRFIRTLSSRGWTENELSGDAIRSWIRTNKNRIDDVWRFPTPG